MLQQALNNTIIKHLPQTNVRAIELDTIVQTHMHEGRSVHIHPAKFSVEKPLIVLNEYELPLIQLIRVWNGIKWGRMTSGIFYRQYSLLIVIV